MDLSILSIIFSSIAAISSICAIIAFITNKRKEVKSDIQSETKTAEYVSSQLQSLGSTIQELRLEVREQGRKFDKLHDDMIRFDERYQSLEKRVEKLENLANI